MNHRANGGFIDAESKSNRSHNDAHFIGGPSFLILAARVPIHLAVVGDGRNAARLEEVHRLFHAPDRGRIYDHIAAVIFAKCTEKQVRLCPRVTFFDYVAQIASMKAGNVLIWIAQPQLMNDVVPHLSGGTCRECRDRALGKMLTQRAELPVLWTKLVSPFGDAVRFVNSKIRKRHLLKPINGISTGKSLG